VDDVQDRETSARQPGVRGDCPIRGCCLLSSPDLFATPQRDLQAQMSSTLARIHRIFPYGALVLATSEPIKELARPARRARRAGWCPVCSASSAAIRARVRGTDHQHRPTSSACRTWPTITGHLMDSFVTGVFRRTRAVPARRGG
jgi:hypothetical protein